MTPAYDAPTTKKSATRVTSPALKSFFKEVKDCVNKKVPPPLRDRFVEREMIKGMKT